MSKVKEYPSQETIKEHFSYRNGTLYHKTPKRGIKVGDAAGCLSKRGYIHIGFNRSLYKAHRMIWIYHYNENPHIDIDHIDRNRSNNKLDNLRTLTRSENLHNATAKRGNTGGCIGVNFIRSKNLWRPSICVDYNHIQLGQTKDYFEACCRRKSAELKYHIPSNDNYCLNKGEL